MGAVVDVDGTDYIELYAWFGANRTIIGDPIKTYFYGFKIDGSDTGGGSGGGGGGGGDLACCGECTVYGGGSDREKTRVEGGEVGESCGG